MYAHPFINMAQSQHTDNCLSNTISSQNTTFAALHITTIIILQVYLISWVRFQLPYFVSELRHTYTENSGPFNIWMNFCRVKRLCLGNLVLRVFPLPSFPSERQGFTHFPPGS